MRSFVTICWIHLHSVKPEKEKREWGGVQIKRNKKECKESASDQISWYPTPVELDSSVLCNTVKNLIHDLWYIACLIRCIIHLMSPVKGINYWKNINCDCENEYTILEEQVITKDSMYLWNEVKFPRWPIATLLCFSALIHILIQNTFIVIL